MLTEAVGHWMLENATGTSLWRIDEIIDEAQRVVRCYNFDIGCVVSDTYRQLDANSTQFEPVRRAYGRWECCTCEYVYPERHYAARLHRVTGTDADAAIDRRARRMARGLVYEWRKISEVPLSYMITVKSEIAKK